MKRRKIPVNNRLRLNVHAKSHGPISLSLLLQNLVEYAVTNQKPKQRSKDRRTSADFACKIVVVFENYSREFDGRFFSTAEYNTCTKVKAITVAPSLLNRLITKY